MKTIVLLALIFLAGLGQLARAGVDVTAFRVEDDRSIGFGEDKVSRMQSGMSVILSLHGPEADSGVRYGDVKIDEAVDDQGTSLIPANKDAFHDPAKFKDYDNAFFRKNNFGGQRKPADPQVKLNLAQPKRSAVKIARLRGSFTLVDQGTVQSAELGNLNGAGTKTVPFPAGVNLGVTITVESGDNVNSIGIEETGDEALLDSVEVVDASGKKVSNGISSWNVNGGPAHKSMNLERPLEGSMKLVARFAPDRKLTVVPFDLKDIPLP